MAKKLFDFSWQYILHIVINIALLYGIMELTTGFLKIDLYSWSLLPMLLYFVVALFLSDSITHGIMRALFHWED